MIFTWLKRYMPRSLYGRAALILILPVVTLQLVVSVVFIQRHFEGVTEQMTQSVALELRMLLNRIESGQDGAQALARATPIAQELLYQIELTDDAVPANDSRRWYDFSGLVVRRLLTEHVPELRRLLLPDDRSVVLYADTSYGILKVGFARTRLSASNPHQLLVNMIVFGVLMTIIAFIYLRNQLRPITRLASAAEAFGRGHNAPYNPSGAIEVRAAGNAFLDMRARIERQIEQRTMMLSGVSHDLRTPLTRLRLGLAMVEDDQTADLLRDVDDMQRLLDEFLSFAQGEAEGTSERTDPHELVARVVDDAQREGKPVTLGQGEGGGHVMLKPLAVRRAVENLLGNAVRYGRRATVQVRMSDKSLRIRVEDDGPGIPEHLFEEALKPFARLDPARNQDKGSGVGLGLAIAADIARAHGGVLRLGRSEELGGLRADIVIAR